MKFDNKLSFWMNPSMLFCIIWIFTLILYLFNISSFVVISSFNAILYLLFSIFIVYIFGKINSTRFLQLKFEEIKLNSKNIKLTSIICSLLLIYEVIIEFSYFGTLPFLASYSFGGVNYNDAGVIFKYKHNIFVKGNSIFLCGYFFFLYHFTNENKNKYLIGYWLVLFVSLLYLSRSTLVSILVISVMIYLLKHKITIKQILFFIFLLTFSSYVFDKMYFLRNITDVNFYTTDFYDFGVITSVLRGLQGFYDYITSPLSNFLYNFDYGTFNSLEFRPSYLFRGFLPSGFSSYLFGPIDFDTTIFLPNNSNTYTAFPMILFAFGIWGNIVFLIIFAFFMRYIFYKTILNPLKWILILIFFNHIIILSIFSESLFNIVYYFPIFIVYFFPPLQNYNKKM